MAYADQPGRVEPMAPLVHVAQRAPWDPLGCVAQRDRAVSTVPPDRTVLLDCVAPRDPWDRLVHGAPPVCPARSVHVVPPVCPARSVNVDHKGQLVSVDFEARLDLVGRREYPARTAQPDRVVQPGERARRALVVRRVLPAPRVFAVPLALADQLVHKDQPAQ